MFSLIEIVWFLLIGLAAGWLAGRLTTGTGFGAVNDMIVGIIGAIVGGLLFQLLGLNATGLVGRLISATIGAVTFLYILSQIK
jgi:uncharacterized membrane protein YeaQ/YmgE (transglycosylase-associated protein family)